MRPRLLQLRFWLEQNDLFPKGKLALVTLYLFGLDVLLVLIERIAGLFHGSFAASLGGWTLFLSVIVGTFACVLGARWASSRLLWRLRNRLIVTYIFIGVIPLVLLISLAGLAFYLFSGQFAAYILTSKLDSELRSLNAANLIISNGIAGDLNAGRKADALNDDTFNEQRKWYVSAWLDSGLLVNRSPGTSPDLPGYLRDNLMGVIRDHDRFFLRSVVVTLTKRGKLTVMVSRPFDLPLLAQLGNELGEVTLFRLDTETREPTPLYNVGTVPPPRRLLDLRVRFGAFIPVVNWMNGQAASPAPLNGETRFSTLYDHAFSSIGDLGPTIEFLLVILIIGLVIFEAAAWYIGTRLTRSVTRAVAALYRATTHVNRGDFSHRIPIVSRDQISALAGSFNLMTESIEKLVLEQKEKQRLENEITIAQEVQAQLFPRHITQLSDLEVFGFCRPARSVSGDYYDFLPLGSQRLLLAVGDVSGKGISAALLMATIHSAVRAYSIEGIPALQHVQAVGAGPALVKYDPVIPGAEVSPGNLLSLLNHQLYHSTPMEKYATLFLATYDGAGRTLNFSNAGHLPPLVLSQTGGLRKLENGGTVVGLFDDLNYDEGSVQLRLGDIFLAYSDGVTEPENEFGEFGEQRLIELVQENRDLPLERICEIVTAAVDDWIGAAEQPDDVTLVLARAR